MTPPPISLCLSISPSFSLLLSPSLSPSLHLPPSLSLLRTLLVSLSVSVNLSCLLPSSFTLSSSLSLFLSSSLFPSLILLFVSFCVACPLSMLYLYMLISFLSLPLSDSLSISLCLSLSLSLSLSDSPSLSPLFLFLSLSLYIYICIYVSLQLCPLFIYCHLPLSGKKGSSDLLSLCCHHVYTQPLSPYHTISLHKTNPPSSLTCLINSHAYPNKHGCWQPFSAEVLCLCSGLKSRRVWVSSHDGQTKEISGP